MTIQSAFFNNFENIVNRRVNIQEDIKRYQDTLSYASSKVDYSVGENIYMLPSDKNLKIKSGTVRYNNKILVFDGKFSLGKNDKVNSLETSAMKSHTQTAVTHKSLEQTASTHKDSEQKQDITHEEEKYFDSFFNWNIYNMVHVSMINNYSFRHSTHTKSPLNFENLKLEALVDMELRNVFVL